VRSYQNPFRHRTSEQESQQGLRRFLLTFGSGILDMLPENVWDRPVVFQSAPGAGKTSLLRTFTAEALREVADHPDKHADLHAQLLQLDAIEGSAVRILGVRLALKKDYRAIDDLELAPERAVKVFYRLLDAKIVRAVADGLEHLVPRADVSELRWEAGPSGQDALKRIGGPRLGDMLSWSDATHESMLNHLDSVLPPQLDDIDGHHVPYSVYALSGATFRLGESDLGLRPLLMFDDAQEISRHQREGLLSALGDRDLQLHRWVAERYQALTADELIADGEPDRGYLILRVEEETRRLGGIRRRGHRTRGFDRLLIEIADLRAAQTLRTVADEERRFSELLETPQDIARERVVAAIRRLDTRLIEVAEGNPRYDEWLSLAVAHHGYEGAVRRRITQILIMRDKNRRQDTLFAVPLNAAEFEGRAGSGLPEAAALFLRHEYQVPFYAGLGRLTGLASENIEQHIALSGELFEEILARITLDESLVLDPVRQDRIVSAVSDTYWRNIPGRLPDGREIQRLLLHIAALCRRDTYRDTAPYPPGVTGTAISMRDRQRLLDPDWRRGVAGANELYTALSGAIGHNLLRADLDYTVKNNQWMVLYLNRMLCVRFGLPLGYGGFRERPVTDLCAWMAEVFPSDEAVVEPPVQERLEL
jgi:hypothetical protein